MARGRRARATGARATALAKSDGPILFRRRFDLPTPAAGKRRWITFDGIFYQADVWLDGAYLGDPEGYFFPHSFDVTALSRLGDDHVLAVEVTCNPERGTTGRRNITGLFQHSEAVARDWNPGGIWRPVLVYDTGPVSSTGCASCAATPTSPAPTCASTPASTATRHARSACGRPPTAWSSARPSTRWRPAPTRSTGRSTSTGRGCGGRARSATSRSPRIDVEVFVDGEVSDRRSRRTGLREVAWNDWVCSINGERLFLKGANLLPTRPGLADATPADVRRDVELAVEAGLDALRVQAHIADHELYRAADELGMLLLQDFPLQWGYARQIRRRPCARPARPSTRSGTTRRSCSGAPTTSRSPTRRRSRPTGDRRGCAASSRQQLPTWNKSVLDRWVKRAFEQADPTRPTVAHGGVLPHLRSSTAPTATLARLAPWRDRRARRAWPALMPRLVRFVSEFGAQSVPDRRRRVRRHSRMAASSTGRRSRAPRTRGRRDGRSASHPRAPDVRRVADRRRSATRRRSCATTSRRCAGSSTGRRAGSASPGSPTRRR